MTKKFNDFYELDIYDNSKAIELFDLAWDQSHSSGMLKVCFYAEKLVSEDNPYILKSLSNKYNDQYYNNIVDVFKSIGIPENRIQDKIKEYNEKQN